MKVGVEIPVHPDRPNRYDLLREDDTIAQVPALLAVAGVPATSVNWGGEESSIGAWYALPGGVSVRIAPRGAAREAARRCGRRAV